jgi:hypothetical protein
MPFPRPALHAKPTCEMPSALPLCCKVTKNALLNQKYLKLPNYRGREWSFMGVVFEKIVQKSHYFDNQEINQNSGLTI